MRHRESNPQGWNANNNGRNWELDIKDRLLRHGYRQRPEPPSLPFVEPYFVRQYNSEFRNPFRQPMKLDFYVYHPAKHAEGLIVECKTQEKLGSVDEKLYFTVNALKATKKRALLLLMGTGFKPAAVRYCQEQQDEQLVVLTTWDAFVRLFNTDLL